MKNPHACLPPPLLLLLLSLLTLTCHNVNGQPSTGPLQTNGYAYLADFNSSMAMVIVFLVCAFFLVGFFSIYIRRCAETHIANTENGPLGAAAGLGVMQRRRGLDPTLIEKFPMFVYSEVKDLKIGKGALECAVCLSEFEDYETLRLLPKCDHVFHPDCIDAWLASHVTCPVCRAMLSHDQPNISNPDSTDEVITNHHQENVTDQVVNNVSEDNQAISHHGNVARELDNVNSVTTRNGIFGKFPRSHSTGHSLVQPGENMERYTLRLPESVRRQLVSSRNSKLKRSTSYDVVLTRLGSSRKGYRLGGEGSGSSRGKYSLDNQTGRFEPWGLLKTPPFFARGGGGGGGGSVIKSPKNGVDGEGLAVKPLLRTSPVKVPSDCPNGKGKNRSQEPTCRPPV